jgi:hypothetical protein
MAYYGCDHAAWWSMHAPLLDQDGYGYGYVEVVGMDVGIAKHGGHTMYPCISIPRGC